MYTFCLQGVAGFRTAPHYDLDGDFTTWWEQHCYESEPRRYTADEVDLTITYDLWLEAPTS